MIVAMPELMYNGIRQKPEELYLGPNNAKEDPCGTCKNFDPCAWSETDCKAMRTWCNKGTYSVADVMKNIKKAV
tara:strand:- start:306 stop:527 length:222 start_codon:yes stop_codon:yes gene_type:complete